ncbi:MAG: AI-2E family transporter [Actinomycetales bacterium]|nr:AI-2E family transporter [Actinomycetales bacterium]
MAWQPWNQWREFRERQRARVGDHSQVAPPVAIPDPIPPTGSPSLPHTSAFRTGLAGGLGLLAAYGLWQALGALDTVLTLVVVSAFLTLALNPVVERLLHAGLSRAGAVTVVFAVVLVIFTLLGLLVVPPVVTQSTELAESSPQILRDLMNHPWIRDVDTTYHVLDKASQEINKRLADGAFMSQLFGGVLGAGMALLSGIVSVFTVLVLTLYFLVSLPTIKSAAYAMVPAGRRPRVVVLSEEIMRRVGSYAIGQLTVATINACCSYVMMKIVGIPYAAVLAVMVGFLGLIPMIGATLGAILVAAVALFVDPTKALVALVYFLIYQQLENYVISPKIMQRTVSVPGAVTIVAAMIGGALAGVLGALLAIPTAAGLLLLYEEVLVPRQAAR